LAERHLEFDIDELKTAAAKVMNRSTSDIKSFSKLAEGGFNRVFEILMNDGASVLARLPYPSTLPRRLAVASEVATLAFIRAQGIPTLRVLGCSIDDGAVGAEYILMEKLPGRPTGDLWFDLSDKDRLKVLHNIVQLEAKLFDVHLPASGSIYFARDLSPGTGKVAIPGTDGELCIGPYTSQRWWDGDRGNLDIDRGPRK
jgi:aminoglycoside phosphotransferase (APT) family kinase protein